MLKSRVFSIVAIATFVISGILATSRYQPSYSPSRQIPVYSTWNPTINSSSFDLQQGQIDLFGNTDVGIELSGWISNEIDEMYLVGGDLQDGLLTRTVIFPRPDVDEYFNDGSRRFGGFRILLDGIRVDEVNCVVVAGKFGYSVLYSDAACVELLK
jgi:hypothetical protein